MATPLDEERARLREAGYTDEEISRYFVERLRGEGQAPAAGGGAAPQGNMSGVLGNANAVLGHVRATIPVVTSATANLSNPAAPAKSRLKSAAVLVGIGLIVCVLGFAIWQEWQQHIIAATEIQNSQVRKIQAEADAARALNEAQVKKLQAEADAAKALNDAQVKKLEAEAAVAKQVNEAQATKLKADAAVAGEVAAGAKAKSCSERLDLLAKNMIPDDMDMSGGTMTVKPGTASARMMEKYNRECGGITGATGEASEISEQTKLDLAACIKGEDPDSQIKGCTGLLEARSGDYGKLTRDLIYFARASAYREKHENQKIIDDMNTAIQINPTREVLYNLRGIAYMIVDNDKAIADFTKAIELDPSDWRPYRNRSLVYKAFKFDDVRGQADEEKALSLNAPPLDHQAGGRPTPTATPTPTPSYTALATPEPTPQPKALTTYDNYDLAGNDLEHHASETLDACVSACRDNSLCRGVTFDKWNNVCFLKSEAKTLWFNAHGVSAYIDPSATPDYADAPMNIMRVPGRGFPKTGSTNYAESADACDDTCRTTAWCAADTFFRTSHECMMLQTTGEYFPNSDADAGIKRQKNY